MALDGTYTGLQASVADFLNRADITAAIPDFIALAEAQINRRLRVRRMMVTATATVSTPGPAVPTDFLEAISLTLSTGQLLDSVSIGAMAEANQYATGPVPSRYAVSGGNFVFGPAPTAALTAVLVYYAKLPPLAANATNWLLADHPDIYLYGALTQSGPYLKDDPRLDVWGGLFQAGMNDLVMADANNYGARLLPTTLLIV